MKKKCKKNNRTFNAYSREALKNVKVETSDISKHYEYYEVEETSYPKKKHKKSVHVNVAESPKKKLTKEQENMLHNDLWLAEHRDKIIAMQEEEVFEADRKFLLERHDYLLKEHKRLKLAQKEMAVMLEDFGMFIVEKTGDPFEETFDLAWKKDNYQQKRAEFEKSAKNDIAKKLNSCENTKAGNDTLKKHNDFLFKLNFFERTWVELARMTCEEQIETVKRAGLFKKSEDMLADLNHLREKQIERENPRLESNEVEQQSFSAPYKE